MAAQQKISTGLAMIVVTMLWSGAIGQSNDCTNVIISMSPCLNYITGNTSTPSPSCCTQLGTVVRSQPQCLCQVINGGGSSNLGLNINQTQALELPNACNVQTPPVSQCNASPSGSPGSTTPSSPNSNSGGGSKNVPPSGAATSDASSGALAVSILRFLLSTASYVTIFSMA